MKTGKATVSALHVYAHAYTRRKAGGGNKRYVKGWVWGIVDQHKRGYLKTHEILLARYHSRYKVAAFW